MSGVRRHRLLPLRSTIASPGWCATSRGRMPCATGVVRRYRMNIGPSRGRRAARKAQARAGVGEIDEYSVNGLAPAKTFISFAGPACCASRAAPELRRVTIGAATRPRSRPTQAASCRPALWPTGVARARRFAFHCARLPAAVKNGWSCTLALGAARPRSCCSRRFRAATASSWSPTPFEGRTLTRPLGMLLTRRKWSAPASTRSASSPPIRIRESGPSAGARARPAVRPGHLGDDLEAWMAKARCCAAPSAASR